MTIIVLCVMLIILFVIALAVTAFLCWVSATAFNWGIVALVWLFLLNQGIHTSATVAMIRGMWENQSRILTPN